MDNSVHQGTREILRMNEDVATMNEATFVTKWLLTLREYIAGGNVKVAYWLDENNITHFSEVSIIDNAGIELYRVPSILAKSEKLLPREVGLAVGDIMYRADNLNRMIPGKGDVYISNELTNQIIEHKDIETYQSRWDNIFVKYGQEPVFDLSLSNTPTADGRVSTNEDFDDYDEL